ncbi:MAG TPA: SDR family NAD(P)-dependent oxidoreductase [Gemmataceae bacterium]|jgi:short-subunit dehydrogenase|nr:SDR family NAD(P)-dependent oxidoreductase [Gemmataceae bacterium]
MNSTASTKVAVLTGASSGIGRALAKELMNDGYRLGLLARRTDELQKLADEMRSTGGIAEYEVADVSDREATISAIHKLAALLGSVDLLIANAGMGGHTELDPMNTAENEQMFRVNVFGVMHAIEAALPAMLQRGSGHLAAVSSLAAYKGLPGSAGYCASKAAVKIYMEALRIQLRSKGIHVTTIFPGFVRTPMTELHPFKMPFLLEPDEAARRVARALRRKKKEFHFPWQTERLVKFSRWLPDWIMERISRGTY